MSEQGYSVDTDFVETNVILANTIEWDALSVPVSQYLSERGTDKSLVTSDRVFDESKRVVEKQRKRVREVADKIYEDFDSGYFDTIDDLLGFIHREFHDKWEKLDPIKEYVKYYDSGFLGLTDSDSLSNLRLLYDDIKADFDDVEDLIEKIRRGKGPNMDVANITDAPESYIGLSGYDSKYHTLNDFLRSYDRDILLDAFWHTQESSQSSLVFVSFDSDVYDNTERIQNCLNTVHIHDTTTFLNS